MKHKNDRLILIKIEDFFNALNFVDVSDGSSFRNFRILFTILAEEIEVLIFGSFHQGKEQYQKKLFRKITLCTLNYLLIILYKKSKQNSN